MTRGPAVQSQEFQVSAGVRINVRRSGNGPITLFLHGIGGHSGQWSPVFDRLHGTGCLIAWDARGYGQSSGPNVQDFTEFAGDLIALIDVLGATRVPAVGHSMGGRILIEAACRAPERFGALLLSGAQTTYLAHMSREDAKAYVAARRAMFDGRTVRPDMARAVAKQVLSAGAGDAQIETLAADFSALNRAGFLAALEASLRWDRRTDITNLNIPIEIVGGALDPICPANETRELAMSCGAEPVLLEGVAHMPQIEAPDRFAGAIGRFIGRHSHTSCSFPRD